MSEKRKERMVFQYNDGGRKETRKGHTGDCVARSIVIASGKPYEEVYAVLAKGNANERVTKRTRVDSQTGKETASHGINTTRKWFKDQMKEWGFEWTACMGIGTGCKVHLVKGELPMGRLVVLLSKHLTAVIDGVINDTGDPQRENVLRNDDGTKHFAYRCVYGYWEYKGTVV